MEVSVRKHWIVLAAFSLTALAMSWPLAQQMMTSIPGVEGDAASYLWALGWAKTALVDLQVNPFHSDYVFYPLGGASQLLWAVSILGLLSIPLQIAFGLVAAYNLTYLAATVLSAYGTFLLVLQVLPVDRDESASSSSPALPVSSSPLPPFATWLLTDYLLRGGGARRYGQLRRGLALRWLPAFAAGLAFAFAPLRLGYGLGFLNLFNTEFIPFYLLFLIRATRTRLWRDAVLAGLFLGFNAYVDFQIAAFLILLTAFYLLYVLLSDRSMLREKAVRWLGIGLISLVVSVPILAQVAGDFAVEGGDYIQVYKIDYSAARAYDLLSYLLPNARSTLYRALPLGVPGINAGMDAQDGSALSPDRQAFVGYIVLALAAYGAWRGRREARFWLIIAAVFALFSLGPSLRVLNYATPVPLPFLVLHEIPIVNHIRIPMRYGIVVSFAMAVLLALGVQALVQALERQEWTLRHLRAVTLAVGCLVPVLLLAESANLPYPVQSLPIPGVYEEIAREPGDYTILEIPTFNWRWAAAAEAYQAIHRKRILRAYTNRIAPGPAEYVAYRGTPIVVRSLRMLEGVEPGGLSPEDAAEDRRVRDQVLAFFDLRYAVVHRNWLKPDEDRAVEAYLTGVLDATKIYDDGETAGYALPRSQAPETVSIDLRENIGQMYAGRGWQFEYPPANWDGEFNFVWARGAQSEIYFVAPRAADRTLILHAHAAVPQRVAVFLGDQPVGTIELTTAWQDYSVPLPASVVRAGMNVARLSYGASLSRTIGVTTIQIR